jgi:predicted pore-forming effector associated with SMODS systems
MSSRSRITALIGLVTIAWVITLIIEGVPVSVTWLQSFSIVQLVVSGGIVLFNRVLWRLPLVSTLVGRPVIQGTWRGEIYSSFVDTPIPSYLSIRQTYSRIELYVITAKGRSHTRACQWGATDGGSPGVFYIYQLVPDILGRADDPVRFGGGVLEISNGPSLQLHGPYWTDARTLGRLSFAEKSKKVCTDLHGAERLTFS